MLFELYVHLILFKIIFIKSPKSFIFWLESFLLQIFYMPLDFFFIYTLPNSSNFSLQPIDS